MSLKTLFIKKQVFTKIETKIIKTIYTDETV